MKMTPFNSKTLQIKGISFWLSLLFLLISALISAQTTQTFTTSGTFTVPAGVTSITVEAWGGGGSGGGSSINKYSGGGGGGGAYSINNSIAVTPGQIIPYTVGSGGIGGSGNGANGGITTFLTISANGGNGGSAATSGNVGSGGSGGLGGTFFGGSGRNGYNGPNVSGGGGGSSAGVGSNGTSTSTSTGAIAPIGGGSGGNGGATSANGLGGSIPGGGGGGGGDGGSSTNNGGNGGSGQIKINWIQPTLSVSPSTINFSYVINGGISSVSSFSLSGTNLTGALATIAVNAPANFEVSLTSGSGFSSSVNVPYSSSTLVSTPIYVRFKPTASNTDYSGNITNSGGGATVNVGVSGTTKLSYCTSTGNTTYQTSITNVQFNTINNASAKPSGYSNYTSISTNVNIGNSYNLSVNVNTDGNYTIYTYAWVDWNQDGDFLDALETFNLGTATTTTNGLTSLSPLSITIPSGAILGTTRMRISTKYPSTSLPTSCESAFDGEVEDYTINILPCIVPGTPGIITGTAAQCPALTSQTYSIAAVTNANTYTWLVPTGWSITAGAGTTSISVTTGATGQNGNISVTAGDSCGTSTARTLAVTISPAAPAAPITSAGSNAACTSISANWSTSLNATAYFLDVSTVNTFASFVGLYNNLNVGNVLTTSLTGLSDGTTYYYRVRANNSCGTSASSGTINYATSPATPATPGVITGTTAQCPALTGQTYSITSVPNATTYTWAVPTGWNITAGQGTTSVTVTTGSASQNGNITVTAGNSCGTSSAQTLTVVVNSCINKWKGTISNDWNTPGNWTQNYVPSIDANIIFDDAPLNHLVLDQNRSVTDITNNQLTYRTVLNGKKLTLKGTLFFTGGATVDATSTNANLEFAGSSLQTLLTTDFYNNEIYNLTINNGNNLRLNGILRLLNTLTIAAGNLDAMTNSPTMTYAGSTIQSIESNQFLGEQVYNLSIDNATGVNLNTNFNITNTLQINAGKKLSVSSVNQLTALGTITNNGRSAGLVLKSDINGTASLLHNSNNVTATVQRFISRAAEDWHFLSSPVSNQLINGSWLPSGTYGNGTGYDLYVWNETTFCWIYKLDTTNWNLTHSASNFVTARGYLYSFQATKPTKTFEGNLNNGSLNYPLTKSTTTDLILKELEGYNLIGNPYPSTMDWSAASGWSRTNLLPSAGGYDMWIWNPATNNYGVYNSTTGIGTNAITQYIAPMQGYFVRAANNGNLSMDNAVRVHTGAGNWFRTTNTNAGLIRITVQSETGKGADEALLQFGYPKTQWGASKIFSHVTTAPSLYLNAVKEDYSVQYLTNTIENTIVPVAFKAGADGYYTLKLNFDHAEFDFIQLEDLLTKTKQAITAGETYRFKATVKDTDNRFVLHFAPSDGTIKELPVKMYTDGVQLFVDLSLLSTPSEVAVYDILGKLLLKKSLLGASLHAIKINGAPQVLIVRLQNEQGILNRKLFFYSIK